MLRRPGLHPNWDPTREELADFGKSGFFLLFGIAIAIFVLQYFSVIALSQEAAATVAEPLMALGAFGGVCGLATPHTLTPMHLVFNGLYWPLSVVLRLFIHPKQTATQPAQGEVDDDKASPTQAPTPRTL